MALYRLNTVGNLWFSPHLIYSSFPYFCFNPVSFQNSSRKKLILLLQFTLLGTIFRSSLGYSKAKCKALENNSLLPLLKDQIGDQARTPASQWVPRACALAGQRPPPSAPSLTVSTCMELSEPTRCIPWWRRVWWFTAAIQSGPGPLLWPLVSQKIPLAKERCVCSWITSPSYHHHGNKAIHQHY